MPETVMFNLSCNAATLDSRAIREQRADFSVHSPYTVITKKLSCGAIYACPLVFRRNGNDQTGEVAKTGLLECSHALRKCGLFDNWRETMIPMENGDIIRFKTTGYEIADIRNPDPPKEWTGVMIGGPNDTHVVLHCEREGREAGAVWVALANVINNDTLGIPNRTR